MILCAYNSIQETEFDRLPPLGQKSWGNRSKQKGIPQIIDHATSAYIRNPYVKLENNHVADCSSENSAKEMLHSNVLVPLPFLAPNRHGKFEQANRHS